MMVTQVTVNKASPQLVTPQPYFAYRLITVKFVLSDGNTFGITGTNTLTVSGLRVSAKIVNAGGRSMGTAQVAIYGMTPSQMNTLSTLGSVPTATKKNTIYLMAGDAVAGLLLVFQGTIVNAYADFNSMPETAFRVSAHVGAAAAVEAVPPISIKGSADVAFVLSQIAAQMGLTFENNGVNIQIRNPYWPRTLREQALAIVHDAGIQWNGGADGVLAIWPTGGSRTRLTVTAINPQTGMIGYPAFTANGIILRTLFNPKLRIGDNILVTSSLPQACGTWTVYAIDHDIESGVPRGDWLTRLEAAVPGLVPVAP